MRREQMDSGVQHEEDCVRSSRVVHEFFSPNHLPVHPCDMSTCESSGERLDQRMKGYVNDDCSFLSAPKMEKKKIIPFVQNILLNPILNLMNPRRAG